MGITFPNKSIAGKRLPRKSEFGVAYTGWSRVDVGAHYLHGNRLATGDARWKHMDDRVKEEEATMPVRKDNRFLLLPRPEGRRLLPSFAKATQDKPAEAGIPT